MSPVPSKSRRTPRNSKQSTQNRRPARPATQKRRRRVLYRSPVNYSELIKHIDPIKLAKFRKHYASFAERYPRCPRAKGYIKRIAALLELHDSGKMDGAFASLSNDETTLSEGSFDIPVVYDNGATPIQRRVRITKPASTGNAGSGYYAQLNANDLAPYVNLASSAFRVRSVESWSLGSESALVAVQNSSGSAGTEILGASASNYTRIGSGFCGILTRFPMGALPLYLANENTNIVGHNVGSATGLQVIFDIILECLI